MANALNSCPEIFYPWAFQRVSASPRQSGIARRLPGSPCQSGISRGDVRKSFIHGGFRGVCRETPCLRGLQRGREMSGVDSAALNSRLEIFYPRAFQRVSASPRQSGIARRLPGSPCQSGISRGGARKSFIHAGFRGGCPETPCLRRLQRRRKYLASIQPPCSCSRALAATRNSSTIGPLSSRPPPGT